MNEDQKIISITGGIASGKSTVADIISQKGYKVIRSDDTAKLLMKENQSLKNKLIAKFGSNIYSGTEVNKDFISKLIFGSDEKSNNNRDNMNSIVHPFVIEENYKTIEDFFNTGEKIVFVESALTFEASMEDGYDYIICTYSEEEVVRKRLQLRNNFSDDQITQRLESQLSPQYKKSHSDFTIENNSDLDTLKNTTEFILDLVVSLPGKDPQKYEEDN
ncbi:dephospho-CoA kinase [Candidatus Kapabacteria bacterium]|nr:dephospho-CoA kinase [Candidatus Kapabacteria bacterium]